MPKMTKIRLKLTRDRDIYIFFEKGTRSRTFNRYSKASNKYFKSYGSKQEAKHIIYLDENNLYGCAMSKFFPASRFKWIYSNNFDLYKNTRIVQENVFSKFILNI